MTNATPQSPMRRMFGRLINLVLIVGMSGIGMNLLLFLNHQTDPQGTTSTVPAVGVKCGVAWAETAPYFAILMFKAVLDAAAFGLTTFHRDSLWIAIRTNLILMLVGMGLFSTAMLLWQIVLSLGRADLLELTLFLSELVFVGMSSLVVIIQVHWWRIWLLTDVPQQYNVPSTLGLMGLWFLLMQIDLIFIGAVVRWILPVKFAYPNAYVWFLQHYTTLAGASLAILAGVAALSVWMPGRRRQSLPAAPPATSV